MSSNIPENIPNDKIKSAAETTIADRVKRVRRLFRQRLRNARVRYMSALFQVAKGEKMLIDTDIEFQLPVMKNRFLPGLFKWNDF